MIIYHTVSMNQQQNNVFVKINGIEYDVEIRDIIKSNQNENQSINLDSFFGKVADPMTI